MKYLIWIYLVISLLKVEQQSQNSWKIILLQWQHNGTTNCTNGEHSWQLIIMSYLMVGENVYTCHDCVCWCYTLIAT